MDENNILDDETLARVAGGTAPGGDLWNYAVISTYLPQLEQLSAGACEDDRALVQQCMDTLQLMLAPDYGKDKAAYIRLLTITVQQSPFRDKHLAFRVVTILHQIETLAKM